MHRGLSTDLFLCAKSVESAKVRSFKKSLKGVGFQCHSSSVPGDMTFLLPDGLSAIFLLRQEFGYPHSETIKIARIVHSSRIAGSQQSETS
jgi:hypothetical protein